MKPLASTSGRRSTPLQFQTGTFSERALLPLLKRASLIPWKGNIVRSRFTHVGSQGNHLLGYPLQQWYEPHFWFNHLHPEDADRAKRSCAASLLERGCFEIEYRVLNAGGGIVWIRDVGRAVHGAGRGRTLQGLLLDITPWKEAERKLHDLGGSLIAAQECERGRIARELHDDVSQRLSVMAVELDFLAQFSATSKPDSASRATALAEQVRQLTSDIHALSHGLHTSKLEQLGLMLTVRALCREVTDRRNVHVEFSARDVPVDVPAPIQLCLYRIAQECLQNVIKHSATTTASVEIIREGSDLCLLVTDEGSGFDRNAESSRNGLGFISMEERLRLVHGTLTVYSSPGRGTRVEARVPLADVISETAGRERLGGRPR